MELITVTLCAARNLFKLCAQKLHRIFFRSDRKSPGYLGLRIEGSVDGINNGDPLRGTVRVNAVRAVRAFSLIDDYVSGIQYLDRRTGVLTPAVFRVFDHPALYA